MMQKDCSATRDNGERSRTVDYVREEVADAMIERLLVRGSTTLVDHPPNPLGRILNENLIRFWILAQALDIFLKCLNRI